MKNLIAGIIVALSFHQVSFAQTEYPTPNRAEIPAFPGADGAGKYTPEEPEEPYM